MTKKNKLVEICDVDNKNRDDFHKYLQMHD